MNTKHRYITGFDGIRTIAVLGVIFYHLFPNTIKGGYLGVPVFFVISGYLIVDLLRQEWESNQKIHLKAFYFRRIKRLYPALIGLLVLCASYITLFQRNLLNNLRGVVFSILIIIGKLIINCLTSTASIIQIHLPICGHYPLKRKTIWSYQFCLFFFISLGGKKTG